ncbi:MAG: hypothetical protein ACFB2X_14435 [Rivularia sp. (in: cyanobacteria)]
MSSQNHACGKDEYKNYQLLHRHCHDKKSNYSYDFSKLFSVFEVGYHPRLPKIGRFYFESL